MKNIFKGSIRLYNTDSGLIFCISLSFPGAKLMNCNMKHFTGDKPDTVLTGTLRYINNTSATILFFTLWDQCKSHKVK